MNPRPTVSSVGFDDESPFRQQFSRLLRAVDEPRVRGGDAQLTHESSRSHFVLGGQASAVFITYRDPLPMKCASVAECQLSMALEHVEISLRPQDIRTQQAILRDPASHFMPHPFQEPLDLQHDGAGNIRNSAGQQETDSHIERLISGSWRNGAPVDSSWANSPQARATIWVTT